jgi:hypothetical protein
VRTQAELEADMTALAKEISAEADKIGGGMNHLKLFAVLDAVPDLKKRFGALNEEAKLLEASLHTE